MGGSELARPTVTVNGANGFVGCDFVFRFPVPLPLAGLDAKRPILSVKNFRSAIQAVLIDNREVARIFIVPAPEPASLSSLLERLRAEAGLPTLLTSAHSIILKEILTKTGSSAVWEKLATLLSRG